MKIKGKKLSNPNREIIAIPRAGSDDIIFIAEAILDYEEFDAMIPEPKPGVKVMKGGEKVLDFDSPNYKSELKNYGIKRYQWMVLKSLRATPDLEWETVNYGDPSTWHNYEKELKDAGFSNVEFNRILKGVSDANCLNEEKVEEARKRFLAGIEQALLEKSSCLSQELSNTQSGDAAKIGD